MFSGDPERKASMDEQIIDAEDDKESDRGNS